MVDVSFISLVNLIRDKRVVTELIQHNCEAGRIYNTLLPLLTNSDTRKAMMEECIELRKDLGEAGASKNAAKLVVSFAAK
jgi:lipid-A-disaccharide synthase